MRHLTHATQFNLRIILHLRKLTSTRAFWTWL